MPEQLNVPQMMKEAERPEVLRTTNTPDRQQNRQVVVAHAVDLGRRTNKDIKDGKPEPPTDSAAYSHAQVARVLDVDSTKTGQNGERFQPTEKEVAQARKENKEVRCAGFTKNADGKLEVAQLNAGQYQAQNEGQFVISRVLHREGGKVYVVVETMVKDPKTGNKIPKPSTMELPEDFVVDCMIVGERNNMAKDATGAAKEVIVGYVGALTDPAQADKFANPDRVAEASKGLAMISEFVPVGLTQTREAEKRLTNELASRDETKLRANVDTANKEVTAAQEALDRAGDPEKADKRNSLTEAQTKLATAKKAIEDREQLQLQLNEAKKHLEVQEKSTEAVRRLPPTGEALAQYTTELTNGAIEVMRTKHEGEVSRLTAERDKAIALKPSITDPAEKGRLDADITRLQAQIRAEQEELDKLKLMTDHPEIFADFFRQMQNGEIPKDAVEKVQKALEAGDGSQLLKSEFMGEILNAKMEALKKRLGGSNDPRMKSLYEKYKPFLLTGGFLVYVLYQALLQAMNKEDRNGGH